MSLSSFPNLGRDDYRIKYEVLNKDLNELRDKVSKTSNLITLQISSL